MPPDCVKSYPAALVKSDGDTGTFTALVSVFGNVDKAGDVVMHGAFTRSLEERGLPPVFYSHQWEDGPIGHTTKAVETEDGLLVEAKLYLEDPTVKRIYQAMKAGALREFSFAYDVREASEEIVNGETVVKLTDLELYEVGPTLIGMNPDTELVHVRSAGPEKAEADEPPPARDPRLRGLMLARPR